MKIDDFFTSDIASAGIKVPLPARDGSPTEEWILVRGMESDEYRAARDEQMRAAMAASAITDVELKAQAMKESVTRLLGALVAEWSLETPCTPENVAQLITKAPYIGDLIDRKSADRRSFFSLRPEDSSTSSGQSSTSGSA